MTRNLYLGVDIQRPIAATAGKTGAEALVALGNSTHEVRAIVDQTDFATRSKLLAREIAGSKPDLVGLQEVALWRSGPIELPPDGALGVPNATHVDQDFLKILLWRLAQRGAYYVPVSVQVESDIESPSFLGSPFDGTHLRPLRSAADHARRDPRSGSAPRCGSPTRAAATTRHGSTSTSPGYRPRSSAATTGSMPGSARSEFRFVNTHLEAFSSDLALFQAQELMAGPVAGSPGTTIIVCDCNSDPLDHTVKPTDPLGTPHSGPYDFIVGIRLRRRVADVGVRRRRLDLGAERVRQRRDSAGFDHRIDMVFARGTSRAASRWSMAR